VAGGHSACLLVAAQQQAAIFGDDALVDIGMICDFVTTGAALLAYD
jgi:hypothetical protein